MRCSSQLGDPVIHLLQWKGKWFLKSSQWGCYPKNSVYMCVFLYIYIEGAQRVNLLPAPETGNGFNMGLSVASFMALGNNFMVLQDQSCKVSEKYAPSENCRCFTQTIWNHTSQVGFTETQRFLNSVTRVADDEIIWQERFMSSVVWCFHHAKHLIRL